MSTEKPSQPSLGDRFSIAFVAFVRALVRFLLIVIVAGVIGALLYFGVPRFYRQYVIPVEENSVRIEGLIDRQETETRQLNDRLSGLQDRLESLEVRGDQDKQTIADIQSQLADTQELLGVQTETLDASLARLDILQAALDEVDASIVDTDQRLAGLNSDVGESVEALSADIESTRDQIQGLVNELSAADTPLNSLRRELQLVRAMELISRSRLLLFQRNEGLAERDIQLARDLLVDLQTQVLDYQRDALAAIISRLDLALANFPDNLELAENDLEVSWELLVAGLPGEPPDQAEGTAAEGTSPVATPTAAP